MLHNTPTRTSYDVLDRVISTTLPDGSTISKSYDFGNDRNGNSMFHTETTDPLGNTQQSYANNWGQQIIGVRVKLY